MPHVPNDGHWSSLNNYTAWFSESLKTTQRARAKLYSVVRLYRVPTFLLPCRQVNEIRKMIDKIAVDVDEVKKKHSAILSAPQTDDSQYFTQSAIGLELVVEFDCRRTSSFISFDCKSVDSACEVVFSFLCWFSCSMKLQHRYVTEHFEVFTRLYERAYLRFDVT